MEDIFQRRKPSFEEFQDFLKVMEVYGAGYYNDVDYTARKFNNGGLSDSSESHK